MPPKPRGAAGEPVAIGSEAVQPPDAQGLPPPRTEGMTTEIEKIWEFMIKGLAVRSNLHAFTLRESTAIQRTRTVYGPSMVSRDEWIHWRSLRLSRTTRSI